MQLDEQNPIISLGIHNLTCFNLNSGPKRLLQDLAKRLKRIAW